MLIYCRASLPPDSHLFDKYCWKEGQWLWYPLCNKCQWWLSLPMLQAFQVREMKCPSSQLCRLHMTLQTTVTWVWNSLLQHLLQELYLCSGFCFTSWASTFVSSTFCLSCLSLHLCYPILFTNAHHWISWRSELSSAISFFQL